VHGDASQHSDVRFPDPYAVRPAPPLTGGSGGQFYVQPGLGTHPFHGVPVFVPLHLQQQQQQQGTASSAPAFHPYYSAIPMYSSDYCAHGNASLSFDGRWQMDPSRVGGVVHLPDCQFAAAQQQNLETSGLLLRSSSEPVDVQLRPACDNGGSDSYRESVSAESGEIAADVEQRRDDSKNETADFDWKPLTIPSTSCSGAAGETFFVLFFPLCDVACNCACIDGLVCAISSCEHDLVI
jgi:hypothetical protein